MNNKAGAFLAFLIIFIWGRHVGKVGINNGDRQKSLLHVTIPLASDRCPLYLLGEDLRLMSFTYQNLQGKKEVLKWSYRLLNPC